MVTKKYVHVSINSTFSFFFFSVSFFSLTNFLDKSVKFDNKDQIPKVPQGYQFNIFYPDWTSKKSPTFEIIPTENPDLVVLVFKAQPPYRDIAFKIANSEWEHSQKKGYRSDFSNGILHLHFNFKKLRYRR